MLDYQQPDAAGHFGPYGGSFASETLTHALTELREAYAKYPRTKTGTGALRKAALAFTNAAAEPRDGRRANLPEARRPQPHRRAQDQQRDRQAMLAKRMGKPRIIAETGAGQHGVATATICARYGLECVVYMGAEDIRRQSPNVYRMKLLGATVVPVESGSKTLKDALNEAMRDWVANVDNTFYIIGTVAGPHPYPMMVRDFQSVIGKECLTQMPALLKTLQMAGEQPDAVIACVGGGSNAMGIFHPYIPFEGTQLIGEEAAGRGSNSGKHSASLQRGSSGVLHGNRTFILQDDNGQITETHSVSAGLDYPGVGPDTPVCKNIGRAQYAWHYRPRGPRNAFHLLWPYRRHHPCA
ncbi:hypothetical protein FQA39_LY19235 [Lamprigera yunnana]|nr:hypothetical protein FQA39_LY19235 [Lamprigera yunnana]